MGKLFNRAKMTVSAVNNGASPPTITLSSAVSGYQTFASAGVSNGDTVSYVIEDGSNFEIGEGSYNSSTLVLSRSTIESSSNSGSAITATTSAQVFVSVKASDLTKRRYITFSSSGSYTPASDVKAFLAIVLGATGGRSAVSGGVGGAGYSEKYYSSGFAGSTYTVTIGAGGATTGTSGGTTSFQLSGVGPSVTGSAGVTTTTGGTGGAGSGGDANFTGGSGGNGNGTTSGGGGGGSASRAGNGGDGAAASGSTGGAGGGTGGNAASGATPGAAASGISGSVRADAFNYETFLSGFVASTATFSGLGASPYSSTLNSLYTASYPGAYFFYSTTNITISQSLGVTRTNSIATATAGQQGAVYIVEYIY